MPHEHIYAENDPTWHITHPTDAVKVPDRRPGIRIEWHEHGAVGIATGDLTREGLETDLTAPEFLVELEAFFPPAEDSDTAETFRKLTDRIAQVVRHAYDAAVATPYFVWVDRANLNHTVKVARRARNSAYGVDE